MVEIGLFPSLAIVCNVAINTCEQVCLNPCFPFFGGTAGSGGAKSHGGSLFDVLFPTEGRQLALAAAVGGWPSPPHSTHSVCV